MELLSHESIEKIREVIKSGKGKEKATRGLRMVGKFRERFPFREDLASIEKLSSHNLYDPDSKVKDYFFYWIQYKLKDYGHINVGSDLPYRNACEQIENFKLLLKTAVDDNKSLAEKVDAPWQKIKFFGGDRNLAKKIVCCYYPNKLLNVFKTEDLEFFSGKLGIDLNQSSLKKYGASYENLSLGQKYELMTDELLNVKNSLKVTSGITNIHFGYCLYNAFPEVREIVKRASTTTPARKTTEPLNKLGLLFEPRTHEELLYLFGVMHRDLGFPYVIKVQTEYPDVIALNKNRKVKRLELEVMASHFDHDPSGCDFISVGRMTSL